MWDCAGLKLGESSKTYLDGKEEGKYVHNLDSAYDHTHSHKSEGQATGHT